MKCVNLNNRPCQARPTLVKVFFFVYFNIKDKTSERRILLWKKANKNWDVDADNIFISKLVVEKIIQSI